MSFLTDEISITWDIEDVKSLDESLAVHDCRLVLASVERNHDAEIGVNWGVIQLEIDALKERRKAIKLSGNFRVFALETDRWNNEL